MLQIAARGRSYIEQRLLLLIGLTGGIGSGKSAVSRCFERLGVPVIDADQVAREVVEPGQPALAEIAATFGADLIHADGGLDRTRLRERVFADPNARRRLEGILHPRIRTRMRERLAALPADTPYAVFVIPLLFETGQQDTVDRVLVVEAAETVRIARVTGRDGVTEDQVQRILAAQCSAEDRAAGADDLISNEGSESELAAKVAALHEKYLALARRA
jgi:dephospho-CoA kinase